MNIHLKSLYTKITVILGVLAVVFCFSLLIFATPVAAQTDTGDTVSVGSVENLAAEAGATVVDIRVLIARVIRIALGLLGIVALVIVLFGGYLWMTAGGNEEQIASAKKVLTNGTVGLIIILGSFGIVSMVLRALTNGDGGSGGFSSEGIEVAREQNFYGAGGLGGVIKDHYPERGAINIPRNAKIIVTFRKPIKVGSFTEDQNADGIFGNCKAIGSGMSWENDCDKLKKGDGLISVKNSKTGEEIAGATVMASYENNKVYTIVLRPFSPLGSATEDVQYTVRIGKDVLFDDSANDDPSIFGSSSKNFYDWNFITNSKLDSDPPYVTSVFPASGSEESKNSVIQIDFNEAIDPIGVQGAFQAENNYFVLNGSSVFLKADNSNVPVGEFRLTNGYKTLEFTPQNECGQNACGGTIYCMNVCDKVGANCSVDSFTMLLRAAQTFTSSSFESLPFSGIMDVTGNALDGNHNGVVNNVTQVGAVFPDQLKPDNYSWSFKLTNKVDLTAPYLKQVTPGPETGNISADQEMTLLFSKRMRVEPMYTIYIDQHPTASETLCHVPRINFNDDDTTLVKMNHCPFNVKSLTYYYPIVGSEVEDVKFNCFYPGKGPVSSDATTKSSEICDDNNLDNCCAVSMETGQAFCCNGLTNLEDKEACILELKRSSPVSGPSS